MEERNVNFSGPAELADLLEQIGMRLHAKNRIWAGESDYYWHLAEVIRKAGRLALLASTEPELTASFGDGEEAGAIPDEQKADRFLELLKQQTP